MMKKSSTFVLLVLLVVFIFFYNFSPVGKIFSNRVLAQTSDITATVQSLPGAVAQVKINSITDNTIPSITANVVISNESVMDYEYTYEWCVVSEEDNECGGGDDVFAASATKFIEAGEDWNTDLNATVPTPGNYWFKLLVYWDEQSSGSYITFTAEEEEVPPSPPPSGGGGGEAPSPVTRAIFEGIAYSLAQITIFKDGGKIKTVKAAKDANFQIEISGLTSGNYIFGIWAEDTDKRKSITLSYPVKIQTGKTSTRSNIFFPPTISLEKTSIKKGEILKISGQSVPEGEIFLFVNPENIIRETTAKEDGRWEYSSNTSILKEEIYNIKVKSKFDSQVSTFSQILSFGIGRVVSDETICSKADFNSDDKVNLIDFSIFLCWWGKTNPQIDLNNNGVVDLADFSIFLCCWTG